VWLIATHTINRYKDPPIRKILLIYTFLNYFIIFVFIKFLILILQIIKHTDMKKSLLTIIMVFSTLFLMAAGNPYAAQGIVSPAPLLPWQLNGTGIVSFNVGNTSTEALPLVAGQEMILKICLSNGVPNITPLTPANALLVMSGTGLEWFNWSYNVTSNCYTGVQNQTIPGLSQRPIIIQYKVTVNSPLGSPANGFNVNITPPAYTNGNGNASGDDNIASYTYTQAKDYGDAPISYGSAWHIYNENHLKYFGTSAIGTSWDQESSNQPSATANGDDIAGVDDEDGITFPTLVAGTDATITVKVKTPGINVKGFINAWIDWNGNGVFDDDPILGTEEMILVEESKGNGTFNFTVSVPLDAVTTKPIFARFRMGPSRFDIGAEYGPTGETSYGEVEDYMVQVNAVANLTITKTDNKTIFFPGTTNVYTVVVTNTTGATVNATFADNAPAGTTITNWTASFSAGSTGSAGPGSGNISESITLLNNGTATYTITVTVPCTLTGNVENTASITVPAGTNTATDIDVQNEWKGGGTTDWNTASNWTIGVPDCSNRGAVIPAGTTPYPVISTTGNQTAHLNIENGATLTIDAGKDLKVCGCTKICGTDALYLKSDAANGNASFVTTEAYAIDWCSNTGTAKVDLYLSACYQGGVGQNHCWHYISPPVQGALSGVFEGDVLRTYDETSGLYSDNITSVTQPLGVMQGYLWYNAANQTRTFHGRLNDGTVTKSLTRTLITPPNGYNGWNLVGNPYPSEIDITAPGTLLDWTNVDKAVYYFDQAAGNYKLYNITTGAGTGSPKIPSMQGFFVHVTQPQLSGILKFTDDNRTTTGTVNFYKDLPNDLLWLKVDGKNGLNDEVVIYFQSDLSGGFDQDIDCHKLTGSNEAPQLAAISTDSKKLTIDALPFAGKNTIVPLEFYVTLDGTGNYTITASKLESFRSGTTITLLDKKTNTNQVLTENPVYNFSYTEGENAARFELHFYNPFFGIDDTQSLQQVVIYSNENNIYVKDLTGKNIQGQLIVYNLLGQKVTTMPLDGGTLNKLNMNLEQGYYLVEVISNDHAYHGKVYLTR
jgi:hypothetical protein